MGEEHEGALKGNRERRFLLLSEHHDQKPQNRKDYFMCQLSDLILKQSQGRSSSRTWRQELKQRLLEGSACWLAPQGFVGSYRSQGVT